MGITHGDEDRNKTGLDEGAGLFLSGGSFYITWVGNLEGIYVSYWVIILI